jgi:hypothetical protein
MHCKTATVLTILQKIREYGLFIQKIIIGVNKKLLNSVNIRFPMYLEYSVKNLFELFFSKVSPQIVLVWWNNPGADFSSC